MIYDKQNQNHLKINIRQNRTFLLNFLSACIEKKKKKKKGF